MNVLESVNAALSGTVLPIFLIIAGLVLGRREKFFYILHPAKLVHDLKDAAAGGGVSPVRALSVALAGTLGVGNISGVAAAIGSGGAGAVFWMWICGILVMSVKYAEVYLSQEYRQRGANGYYGGAMYYMRDGLRRCLGRRIACAVAAIFAFLIAANSILTGNIVQVNAAASVFSKIPPIYCGAAFAVIAAITAAGGLRRVSDLTVRMIPLLSLAYIMLSVAAIIHCRSRLGSAFRDIFAGAFRFEAAAGGAFGFGVSRAVRFGITRGIFSNEAGCGTAPSAHAAAAAKSPHHQGCMGIFEVFADTIVLCTMTALVMLTWGASGTEFGIGEVMAAFGDALGSWAAVVIGISVVLFALATVVCQSYYGICAIEYFTDARSARFLYIAFFAASSVIGSIISSGVMWQLADLIIALLTVINMGCVLAIFKKKL